LLDLDPVLLAVRGGAPLGLVPRLAVAPALRGLGAVLGQPVDAEHLQLFFGRK
jgi:hypothetical protein